MEENGKANEWKFKTRLAMKLNNEGEGGGGSNRKKREKQ